MGPNIWPKPDSPVKSPSTEKTSCQPTLLEEYACQLPREGLGSTILWRLGWTPWHTRCIQRLEDSCSEPTQTEDSWHKHFVVVVGGHEDTPTLQSFSLPLISTTRYSSTPVLAISAMRVAPPFIDSTP